MTADGSPQTTASYLGAVRRHVDGSRVRGGADDRRRFMEELADHLAERVIEGIADGLSLAEAERRAVAACGDPEIVARSWIDRCRRQRRFTRRRGSTLLALGAMAAVLGVSQHADAGRRAPSPTAPVTTGNAPYAPAPAPPVAHASGLGPAGQRPVAPLHRVLPANLVPTPK